MSHADIYPLIISFFTPTWQYPIHAARLSRECESLGLDSDIRQLAPSTDWLSNTKMKPRFIQQVLEEAKRPVLWIDVDGSILNLPTELTLPNAFDFRAKRKPATHSRVWHVGTMFFNYTPEARAFVEEWATRCERTDDASDELVLDHLWKERSDSGLVWGDLPSEYFQMIGGGRPAPNSNTVIAHRESECESKHALLRRRNTK